MTPPLEPEPISAAKRRSQRRSYLLYRGLTGALRLVPIKVGQKAATLIALGAHRRALGLRAIVRANLRRVVGPQMSEAELDEVVRAAFISYGRYWAESAVLGHSRHCGGGADFTAVGGEHLAAAKAAGKGAVLALPHLGGWEVGAYWAANQGYSITTVAEPLEPPELFEWFVAQREQLGLRVFPLGRGVTRNLLAAVRAGEFIALLADRDLAGDGIDVELFGEATRIPAGPAALALRSGAPLHVCTVYMQPGGGHQIVIRPALDTARTGHLREDLARVTNEVARELEVLVRAAPEQWHVFQPNWPSDRAEATAETSTGVDEPIADGQREAAPAEGSR